MKYEHQDLKGQSIALTEQTTFDTCDLSGAKLTTNGFGYDVINILNWFAEIDGVAQ